METAGGAGMPSAGGRLLRGSCGGEARAARATEAPGVIQTLPRQKIIKCFNSTTNLLKAPRAPSPAHLPAPCPRRGPASPPPASHRQRQDTDTTGPALVPPDQHQHNQSNAGPTSPALAQHHSIHFNTSPTGLTPAEMDQAQPSQATGHTRSG